MRLLHALFSGTALALWLAVPTAHGQLPGGPPGEKKFRDYADVVRGAQKHEGFFTLQQKDDHLFAEIMPFQFDQPMLAPITIARGMAMAGQPMNFGDEWILSFHRAGDRVQLIRRNIHYKANGNSPIEKAVKQNYTDSILMALPIATINPMTQAVLIDFSDIFLGDFAQLGFGYLDRSRTSWHKVKTFANNVELEVEATFGGGGGRGGDDGVVDHRGRTIVIHYTLAKLPDPGYHPRTADNRVGHFLNATKDFTSSNPDTNFVRLVNRWRLEKTDPRAKLSPPKKQIIWYLEDTVPNEYRPFVEEGIREWNKAFEKCGFRDAIAVRWQEPGRDDFDPEDINYCTFRWITTNQTYAMSCLRSNPLTGEMIDGDVIFDASWIRHWKHEYALLTSSSATAGMGKDGETRRVEPIAVGEIISPIMAAKKGYGQPFPLPQNRLDADASRGRDAKVDLVPSGWNEFQIRLRQRQSGSGFASCQYASGMASELGLAALVMADKDKKEGDGKLPEEFLGQMIKEVVMHEVGHSLGLRHNFKASTMLTADQLNDTNITRTKGMVGSVMDYNPINLAPKGQKQGDYTTTTIGPYDYWAIEYAYKPIDGDEETELKKIAARSPEPDLVFATDEDMFMSNDPLVNVYDLGSDNLRFAKDRITLAADLFKDLDTKVVKDGESYAKAREAFSILLNQWGNASYLVANYVGGQSVSRDHKGKGARDPIAPIPAVKQREALKFLVEQILSDKSFKFSPALLRRLTSETWSHWGSDDMRFGTSVEYPINESILSIQKIALSQCLAADVLQRLENHEMQVDAGADTLRMSEIFRAMTDGIWSELTPTNEDAKKVPLAVSTIRRNLQREYVRRLCTIVLGTKRGGLGDMYGFVVFMGGSTYPPDAKSLARHHLKEIQTKISKILEPSNTTVDDTTRAHLEECRHRIAKVLDAGVDSNEP